MKKFLLASVAMLGFVGAAAAADLPARMPVKAPPMVAPAFNWTGCYIGGYAGGATQETTWQSTDIGSIGQGGTFARYNGVGVNPWGYNLSTTGIAGGTLGCNYQPVGSPFVFGIEGEAGYMKLTGGQLQPNSVDVAGSAHIGDWYGMITGRIGYAFDRTLLYVKGGAAFYQAEASVIDVGVSPRFTDTISAAGSKDQASWTIGGGIEWAFDLNWSLKAEYMFIAGGDSFGACGLDTITPRQNFCWTQDPTGIHTAKVGINYRFNWGAVPVVAKY
jgi:outer membrane immunogenic protein